LNITPIRVSLFLINFIQLICLADGKSVILKYVRDYAALGRFYELIKFIERTIPNVRIFYLIKLFYNNSFSNFIQKLFFICIN